MRIFCLLFTLLFFLLAVSPASAIEFQEIPGNIHIGSLEVHPKLDVKEEYNDNIFREANGESGSAITTISPGLSLQLPIRSHFLEIDYHSDLIEASRFHQVYDTDSHFVDVLFNLDFNRLGFLIGDNWASDSTPPDYKDDIRNDYIQNRFYVDTSYKLPGRYMLEGFYRNEFRDFDSFRKPGDFNPELDNYRQYEVGFDLFYRFRPVTSLLFEYAFTHRNNEDKDFPSTDSEAHRFWLGLKWEPTAKLAGVIKGGYVTYAYEGISDDWDGFGLQTDLEYKISPYYFLRLTGFRKLLETSVTREEGFYGTYYISTGGVLELRHIFTYKIAAFIRTFYFNDDYTERGLIGRRRNDDRFGFGCGATYQIQEWLGCRLQYNYVDNNSNINVEDYKGNIVEGLVSFTF